jgi:hypothetical protein
MSYANSQLPCNNSPVGGASVTSSGASGALSETYENNSGNSQLRVRFRMITHQSSYHQFRARISSTTTAAAAAVTQGGGPNAAYFQLQQPSSAQAVTPNGLMMLPQLSPPAIYTNDPDVILPLDTHPAAAAPEAEACCVYDSVAAAAAAAIPPLDMDTKSNIKTFRLTKDLQSNIRFDVTLKPSLKIRDNRLNASSSATSSREGFNRLGQGGASSNQANQGGGNSSGGLRYHHQYGQHGSSNGHQQQTASFRSSSCDVKRHHSRASGGADSSCSVRLRIEREENEVELPIRTLPPPPPMTTTTTTTTTTTKSTYRSNDIINDLPYRANIPLNSSITFRIKSFNLSNSNNNGSPTNSNKSSSVGATGPQSVCVGSRSSLNSNKNVHYSLFCLFTSNNKPSLI